MQRFYAQGVMPGLIHAQAQPPGPMHLLLYYSEAGAHVVAVGCRCVCTHGCAAGHAFFTRSGEGKPPRRLAPRSAGGVLLRLGLHVAGIPRRIRFGCGLGGGGEFAWCSLSIRVFRDRIS